MADVSDSFLVINDVIMASLLLLKVIHMLANILFLQNTKGGQGSIFSVYVYTWIFQNLVSNIINSFYYLVI